MLCFSLQMRLDGEILISANGRLAVCRFYARIIVASCSDHARDQIVFLLAAAFDRFFAQILNLHFLRQSVAEFMHF